MYVGTRWENVDLKVGKRRLMGGKT